MIIPCDVSISCNQSLVVGIFFFSARIKGMNFQLNILMFLLILESIEFVEVFTLSGGLLKNPNFKVCVDFKITLPWWVKSFQLKLTFKFAEGFGFTD